MREEGWGGSRAQDEHGSTGSRPDTTPRAPHEKGHACCGQNAPAPGFMGPGRKGHQWRPGVFGRIHHSLVIAVSYNFVGSPHIDTYDIAPQYALSLGDFTQGGGGELCVEESAMQVAVVDTRGKLAKVDGRFPHWVLPYTGERFSVFAEVGSECPADSVDPLAQNPLLERT